MPRFVLIGLCALGVTRAAAAQVGHEPTRSPYRDIDHRTELVLFGGQFNAATDPARVTPQDGAMLGVHYELRLGGPVYFTARMAATFGNRTEIDPKAPIASRVVGDKLAPTLLTDVGFAMNLTGNKSWKGLVPTIGGGGGIAAGLEGRDKGGYVFGFPFMGVFRPGVKFGVGGRWQGRVDATNYFYRIRYPETYFTKTGADPTVLPPTSDRSMWKRNLSVTLGFTRTFGK